MWQRIQQVLERVFFFAAITVLLTGNAPAPGSYSAQLGRIIGGDQFNFAGWEVEALSEKGKQSVVPIQDYLDDQQRAQFVVDFLDLTRRANAAERKVDSIYSDPAVPDPYAASADQRAERDRLRAELEQRRPMAEAIIDEQIASVLVDEGLAVGGRVFPPVQSRITPLPNILVLSPRDEIKREPGVVLSSDITVDRAEAIENSLFMRLDKSALVTPIGGLAAYPSMIIETPDLLFLLQVMAHEWTHHWLFLRPLGFNLLLTSVSGSDLVTLNETVASLTGNEVGIEILKRYYPDIARRDYPQVYAPRPAAAQPASPPAEPDPNVFSFSREMHKTRVQVDEYLARAHEYSVKADAAKAAGQREAEASLRAESSQWVVKAETYMEERRKLFLANGYRIRKLNQAYFAFYGSYADQPGASGADPIGPAVVELRRKIPKLSDFLNAVAPVTTLDGLRRVLAQYP